MTRHPLNYYLIKISRVTAWCLLGLISLYVCTGLTIAGKLHLTQLLSTERALALHKNLVWILVAVLTPHVVISVYFALRRWGWIGKHKPAKAAAPADEPVLSRSR